MYAPYGYPSRHDDDGDKSRVWVQDRPDFGKVAGYGYKERTGNNVAVDFGVKHIFPFIHVSRAFFTDDTDYNPNMLQANPDGLYRVAYGRYSTKKEAINMLYFLKYTLEEEAWYLEER